MAGFISHLDPSEKFLSRIIPAIGLVATRWTQVEVSTQRMMGVLLKLEGRFALALTAHIGDRTAIDIILSVARQYKLPPGTKEAIEAFATNHATCRDNRNLMVHGIHLCSEKGIKPRRAAVQKLTSRGQVKVSYFELPLETIYKIAAECNALAGYGQRIVSHLASLRPDAIPHELPALFPRLDNRLKTLNPLSVHDLLQPRSYASGWTGLQDQ
jgi:hypothetical protein